MPLKVSDQKIRFLDDEGLNRVMSLLFAREANKCGCETSQIIINTEKKAEDEGQDGYTPAPHIPSFWLGNTETCWQFKSGEASQPSRLLGEIKKERPQKILSRGGRYVLIASGSVSGTTGIDNRKEALIKDAKEVGLPIDKIEVFSCELLTNWVNEHLAIVIELLLGKDCSVLSFEMWSDILKGQYEFIELESFQENVKRIHQVIGNNDEKVSHVHLHGFQGVGKTRLAYEACRLASWCGDVIFIPQFAISEIKYIIGVVRDSPASQVVLVIDNVLHTDLEGLNELAKLADGRLSLITIGRNNSPHLEGIIKFIHISPLQDEEMNIVIKSFFPKMHVDHQRFIMGIAGGFISWGHMIGKAVNENPQLLSVDQVHLCRQILQKMIGPHADYMNLVIPAIMETVGWNAPYNNEGLSIAKHLNLNWTEILFYVHQFHAEYGYAPLSGYFRGISPEPLAIFLAKEAWDALGDLLCEIPEILPSDDSRERFYRRLKVIAANKKGHAAKHAIQKLRTFENWKDFTSAHQIRIWSSVMVVDPLYALQKLYSALASSTHDERLSLPWDARRELIWTLVEARSKSNLFNMAVLSLAELAEAEVDHHVQNSATGEFLFSFHPVLGGTEKPYSERLALIDHVFKKGGSYKSLAMQALAQVADSSSSRVLPAPSKVGPEAIEWTPSIKEYLDAIETSLSKLTQIVKISSEEIAGETVRLSNTFIWMLFNPNTHEAVLKLFSVAFARFPFESEELEASIEKALEIQERKESVKSLIKKTKIFLEKHRDSSQLARFRHIMRMTSFFPSENPSDEISQMASKVLDNPEILWSNWDWLTNSGRAFGTRPLAEVLGKIDKKQKLLSTLFDKANFLKDYSIICFYLIGHKEIVGQDKIEVLIDQLENQEIRDDFLLFELTHFVSQGDKAGQRTIRILTRSSDYTVYKRRLGGAEWIKDLSSSVLLSLISQLSKSPCTYATSLALIEKWTEKKKLSKKIEKITLELISSKHVLEANDLVIPTTWKNLCLQLMPKNASQIAKGILTQITERTLLCSSNRTTIFYILKTSINTDPKGVWLELAKLLQNAEYRLKLVANLPQGIVDLFPQKDVMHWVEQDPHIRVKLIYRLVNADPSEDSLFSILRNMPLYLDVFEFEKTENFSSIFQGFEE